MVFPVLHREFRFQAERTSHRDFKFCVRGPDAAFQSLASTWVGCSFRISLGGKSVGTVFTDASQGALMGRVWLDEPVNEKAAEQISAGGQAVVSFTPGRVSEVDKPRHLLTLNDCRPSAIRFGETVEPETDREQWAMGPYWAAARGART